MIHRFVLTVLSVLVLGLLGNAGAATLNQLGNAGFEEVSDGRVLNWNVPSYWAGTLEPVAGNDAARSGTGCGRLAAAAARGTHWARMLQPVPERNLLGRRFRFSIWARGAGTLKLGCIEYRSRERFDPPYAFAWQQAAVTLDDVWRQVIYDFTVTDTEVLRLTAIAEVQGEGAVAFVDDAEFAAYQAPGFTLSATPPHAMISAGTPLAVHVQLVQNGTPVNGGRAQVIYSPAAAPPRLENLELTAAGTAVYSFVVARALDTETRHRLVFVHPESGSVARVYIDVVSDDTCAQFAAAAAAARVQPLPAHFLFIGDSLTDQQRGYNYVDKLAYWLHSRYGTRVTLRNAGVGGDNIARVWQRLQGDPKAYRSEMYENLYEPKPTHVFFFLGHNDTKVSSSSDYTRHAVEPEVFEACYRQVLSTVAAATGAKITVMSATSSVFETCRANANKRKAAGRAHNLFGKPSELERYNGIAKRVAAEIGAAYLDVYEPTRTHPEKPSLFNPGDGVHLASAGNRFIALLLLQYLGETP